MTIIWMTEVALENGKWLPCEMFYTRAAARKKVRESSPKLTYRITKYIPETEYLNVEWV